MSPGCFHASRTFRFSSREHGAPIGPFRYCLRLKTWMMLAPYFSSRRVVISLPNHWAQSSANRRLSSCSSLRKALIIWTSCVPLYLAIASFVATAEAAPQENWQTILPPCSVAAAVAPATVPGWTRCVAWAVLSGRASPGDFRPRGCLPWACPASRLCCLGSAEADVVVAVVGPVVVEIERAGIGLGVPVAAPDEGIARPSRKSPSLLMAVPLR